MPFPAMRLGRLPRFGIKSARIATFASLLAVFAIIAVLTAVRIAQSDRINHAIGRTVTVRNDIQQVFLLMQGAETAQRGYLLTGQTKYLAPYDFASSHLPKLLHDLTSASNELNQDDVGQLKSAIDQKMSELTRTIALRREGRTQDATDIVSSGLGYDLMSGIRIHDRRLQHG
jgi:CHASE3 domain sensor protein